MALVSGTAYLFLLLLSTLTSVVVSFAGLRNRDQRGAFAFACLTALMAAWSGLEALILLVDSLAAAAVIRQVMFCAIAFVPVTLVILSLQYTGRRRYVTPVTIGLLSLVPIATVLLTLTTPWHGLMWRSVSPDQIGAFTGVTADAGPWYGVHLAYSYLVLAVGSGVLILSAIRAGETHRVQASLILVGLAIPWAGNAVTMFGPWDLVVDPTPVLFSATGVLIGVAVLRYQFLDFVPVARDTVVEVMRDGVLVVDEAGRVVDANSAALDLLETATDEAIGSQVEAVLPAPLVDAIESGQEEATLTVDRSDGRRHLDLRTSALDGGGTVVLLRDVTTRREQARRLERQNERLDRFASVMSHDLRNPINVASGYLDLLATESDVDSEHVARIEQALTRMEEIIDDALALAREGQAVTDPRPVDLANVAREAWDSVVTDAAELRVETDRVVAGDHDRIQRLLENLFRNSIEHCLDDTATAAGEEGDPSLTVSVSNAQGGFAVADDGPGIPEDERDDVFDFGFTTDDDGTGLGLAIVEEIAEAHDWTVRVEAADSGGAKFVFTGVSVESVD